MNCGCMVRASLLSYFIQTLAVSRILTSVSKPPQHVHVFLARVLLYKKPAHHIFMVRASRAPSQNQNIEYSNTCIQKILRVLYVLETIDNWWHGVWCKKEHQKAMWRLLCADLSVKQVTRMMMKWWRARLFKRYRSPLRENEGRCDEMSKLLNTDAMLRRDIQKDNIKRQPPASVHKRPSTHLHESEEASKALVY
jgi:hypothetical protein